MGYNEGGIGMIPTQLVTALTSSLGSIPRAQMYGILAGTMVFLVTISTVAYLAVKGGVFERLYKQEVLKEKPENKTINAPVNRPTLLNELQEVSVTGLDWTGLDWTGLDWTGLDVDVQRRQTRLRL